MNISKSRYCNYIKCPKLAWLSVYAPEKETKDESLEKRFETGHAVGELAKGLFGKYVDVTTEKNGKLDINTMINKTKEEIKKETNVICEAAFSIDGLYCAVDLLKNNGNGWSIYEVKSSTHVKDYHITDSSFQKYVLEKCGLKINSVNIIHINSNYLFDGHMDIRKFFTIEDVSDSLEDIDEEVLDDAKANLNNKCEPAQNLTIECKDCTFKEYCMKDIPTPSVFNLYRMSFQKALNYYYEGKIKFEELDNITNKNQKMQIDCYLDNTQIINKSGIKEFLSTLSYPLYFLDFETEQPAIPKYKNSKPFQQIPFQYSLHYIEDAGGKLKHKEFLAESGPDPRREIAEALCRDIPMDVCCTAYNKSFECKRLEELADLFPDLSDHLLNIKNNMKDFLDPFQKGYYYNNDMCGSFSIKKVLPALFPKDPELDYHKLDQVHHGGEAMSIFPEIEHMSADDKKRARHNLLKYCELDTYAMVKIWEKLNKSLNYQ